MQVVFVVRPVQIPELILYITEPFAQSSPRSESPAPEPGLSFGHAVSVLKLRCTKVKYLWIKF